MKQNKLVEDGIISRIILTECFFCGDTEDTEYILEGWDKKSISSCSGCLAELSDELNKID